MDSFRSFSIHSDVNLKSKHKIKKPHLDLFNTSGVSLDKKVREYGLT